MPIIGNTLKKVARPEKTEARKVFDNMFESVIAFLNMPEIPNTVKKFVCIRYNINRIESNKRTVNLMRVKKQLQIIRMVMRGSLTLYCKH